VQQNDALDPLLFAAGIQAALDALPPGRAHHRCYLDDEVFMGSVAEVEVVLTALQHTLPQLCLELNLRKMTVWGPGLVHAASPPAAPTHLHLEGGTELLGVPIHSPLYPSPVWEHLGALKGKLARTSRPWRPWRTPKAPMRLCGLAWDRKSPVRPPHPAYPPIGGLRRGGHCDPAGHLGRRGGHAYVRRGIGADHAAAELGRLRGRQCL